MAWRELWESICVVRAPWIRGVISVLCLALGSPPGRSGAPRVSSRSVDASRFTNEIRDAKAPYHGEEFHHRQCDRTLPSDSVSSSVPLGCQARIRRRHSRPWSAGWRHSHGLTDGFPAPSARAGKGPGTWGQAWAWGRRDLRWAEPTRLRGGTGAVWLFALGVLRPGRDEFQDCSLLGAQHFSGCATHPSSLLLLVERRVEGNWGEGPSTS